MKIIDAHNHPDWHGHNLERFIANMDQYGISKTWLFSWECERNEYSESTEAVIPAPVLGTTTGPIPFARCLSYVECAPERFILGYAPDARDPQASRKLKAAHDIYGAKCCGEVKCRVMYDNPDCLRLFRTAGDLGMPVTLHFDYDFQPTLNHPRTEWWGGTIDTLENVLKACPDTTFLGHAPGFWVHISDDDIWKTARYPKPGTPVVREGRIPKLLRKYPNLYCDISAGSGNLALSRDPEYAVEFLTEFQDRICYARDYFDNVHQTFLNSLNLPQEILQKIYAGNAEKLVKA